MGSVGDAYDNAMAESLFATLESELLDRQRFQTQVEARMAVFEWIEAWYNLRRRHSSIGYLSPVEFERRHVEGKQSGGFAPVSLNGETQTQTQNENGLREVPGSA